jgi:glycerol-3-phosphate dehydrogenase
LLATTDSEFTGDPATLAVTEKDIADFLATFRKYLPSAPMEREAVEFFYAGLRPLVRDGAKDSYSASRRSELVDHGKEGKFDGLFSALGGKWTTSRALAEKITDTLVARLEKKTPRCATATTPLPGGRFDRFEDMVRGYEKTWPGISSLRNMAHMLGARLPRALKGARLADLAPLGPSGDTPAQIAFAMREEMTLSLEDMVMRRTAIGQFGRPAPGVLESVASRMAAQLGWSEEKKDQEIAGLGPLYRTAQ